MSMRIGRLGSTFVFALCMLSAPAALRAAPWPMADVNDEHPLMSSYGQFYEEYGGLHFHEGIDILVAKDTEIKAVATGTVIKVNTDVDPYNSYMVVAAKDAGGNPTDGFNYYHMVPDAAWSAGGNVTPVSVKLGTAAGGTGSIPSHLHLDQGKGQDPSAWYGGTLKLLKPADDPLLALDPRDDTTKPTLNSTLQFRRADDDALATVTNGNEAERKTSRYFFEKQCNTYLCVGRRAKTQDGNGNVHPGLGDIDIIGEGHDVFDSGGRWLGIHQVGFSAVGKKWGDTTGNVTSLRFQGEFTENHGYDSLRSADLTRVAYENDWKCDSIDDLVTTGNSRYWYILTNKDDDLTIESTDRARFWNTDELKGSAWNAPNNTPATNNAKSAFRDDLYTVTFTGQDEKPNVETITMDILLDNWLQTILTSKPKYLETETVLEKTGEQYSALQTLPLYILTSEPVECMNLTDKKADTTTDGNGVALPKDLGRFDPGQYWLVADYNLDGKYYSRLDAYYPFIVVPISEPAAFEIFLLGAMALARRKRR